MRRFRACAVLVCVTNALSLVRVLLTEFPLVPVDDRCRHVTQQKLVNVFKVAGRRQGIFERV